MFKFSNKTRNHHYVSQAEQRLNAFNPTVLKKNQKIYAFSIVERENYKIELDSTKGVKIEETLSFDDLFTIDVLDDGLRANLENFFGYYEQSVSELTNSLLLKLKSNEFDIKNELLNIFAIKFINTFRNPFCIEKTLNTIGMLANYFPTNEKLDEIYRKIDSGNQAAIEQIAKQFLVTEVQYRKWMKSLFILLVPRDENNISLVDVIIKNLFEDTSKMINVSVFTYTGIHEDKYALLSDRGFTILTNQDESLDYQFNLNCNGFISYVFTDIRKLKFEGVNSEVIDKMLAMLSKKPSEIKLNFRENELTALSTYNKNVVYQSYKTVYCKNKAVYGL